MEKVLTLLFVTFLSVNSHAQETFNVTILVRDQSTGDSLNHVNLLVLDTGSNEVIHSFTTDTTGLIRFKVPKSDSGKVVTIELSRCHYFNDEHELELGFWEEQYQEYYMMPAYGGCGFYLDVFQFKKDQTDGLEDFEEKEIYNHIADMLLFNPTIKISLVGRYNFDEEREIGEKRLQYIKSFFEDKDYNKERINFVVMEPDYVKYEMDYKCDTIYYDQEKFETADPKTLKKFENIYQQVYIRIDSWDYKENDE